MRECKRPWEAQLQYCLLGSRRCFEQSHGVCGVMRGGKGGGSDTVTPAQVVDVQVLGFRLLGVVAIGDCYGWLLWVVAMGGCYG